MPITCEELQNAVLELCEKGLDTPLIAEPFTLDNGDTYIALESTGSLQELAKRIIALKSPETIENVPPVLTPPPSASKVDIVSQFSRHLNEDLVDASPQSSRDEILIKLLQKFKLEDILKTDDVSGKADKTVQVAIASREKEFVHILSYEIEKEITYYLDTRTGSYPEIRINKIKKMFEYVRFITNGEDDNGYIDRDNREYLFSGYYHNINQDISKLSDEEIENLSQYLSTPLNSNSELHNGEKNVKTLYFLTIAIEGQMIFALTFLKRILLLLYQNFEIEKGDDEYKPKKPKEHQLYKYETQKLLNTKLDDFFKMKLDDYLHIKEPIDIKVDDGYAPNKIDDNFSSWTIAPEITVFDLISIIKSMSVYLRLQL
jgi:hypothetical protein